MGIIESVQSYDLNIPVGGAQAIDVAGDRVQFLSANDAFAQIELRPNFAQGNIVLKPGQGFRFSEQVQRWVVFNKGSVALTGLLMIGSGDFFDQRISGDVNVIDNGKSRTMAGQAFVYSLGLTTAATFFPHSQLWNPAGSGKRLILKTADISCTVAAAFGVAWKSSALANNVAVGIVTKRQGYASVAQARTRTDATTTDTDVTNSFWTGNVSANVLVGKVFQEPIVIEPGQGVVWFAAAANCSMIATGEYVEETI